MGRKKGLDLSIRNQLLTVIAILIGKIRLDTWYYPMPNMDDKMAEKFTTFYLTYAKKYWNLTHERAVVRHELERFARDILGIERKTFIKHIKELIKEGIIEEIKLPLRGNYFVYRVHDIYLEKYLQSSQEDLQVVSSAQELSKIMEKDFLTDEFYTILKKILSELQINESQLSEKDVKQKIVQIFEKYPTIRVAFKQYAKKIWNSALSDARNEIDQLKKKETQSVIKRLVKSGKFTEGKAQDLVRKAIFTGRFDRLKSKKQRDIDRKKDLIYNNKLLNAASGSPFVALLNLHYDLKNKEVCHNCLLKAKVLKVTPIDIDNNEYGPPLFHELVLITDEDECQVINKMKKDYESKTATCPICNYHTPFEPEKEILPLRKNFKPQTRTRTLAKCKRCDSDVPLGQKVCPNCGAQEIAKRIMHGWEPI